MVSYLKALDCMFFGAYFHPEAIDELTVEHPLYTMYQDICHLESNSVEYVEHGMQIVQQSSL